MKMRLLLIVLLIMVLAPLALPTPSRAAPADVFNFKREDAFTEFIDRDGCMITIVQVFAVEYTWASPESRLVEADVGVFVSQRNDCSGIVFVDALGFTAVPTRDFKVLGNLGSAELNTTITVEDAVSGTAFPVSVAMSWTGTGDISEDRENDHVRAPDCFANTHVSNARRPAEASGSLSFGSTSLTLTAPRIADLGSERSHSAQKGCEEE